MAKRVSYYVGAEGQVHRKVVRDLGGVEVATSDVIVAASEEVFRKSHADVKLMGVVQRQKSLSQLLDEASPEDLLRLGVAKLKHDEPSAGYPRDKGAGWFELSNGESIRTRAAAESEQAELDALAQSKAVLVED